MLVTASYVWGIPAESPIVNVSIRNRSPSNSYEVGRMRAEYSELMKYLEDSGYVDACIFEDGYFDLEWHYLNARKEE